MAIRTPLPNESDACVGGYAGYGVDLAELGVGARISGCSGGFENEVLRAATSAYDLELRVYRAWDVSALSFNLGLGGGLALFTQTFHTSGDAPARQTAAPFLTLVAGILLDLGAGFYAGSDLGAETYFLRVQRTALDAPHMQVSFALRPSLGVTKRF
jgi:hypothetical protein